ncbi:MAG: hypothetical protein J5973_03145, partial [Eubacterium sp.]|nr:hypothetical protein [Eubacterium sp.]
SKQTFLNAANDPDSIFYHNPSTAKPGPFYSLVCSSFGTLVSGFSYPMTNYSMMKDPLIEVEKLEGPRPGSLMSNGTGHCYVPIVSFAESGGKSVLALAEQIGPLTAIRDVFSGIPGKWQGIGPKASYASSYIYRVSPAVFDEIPYDILTGTIKNGSARPFCGDQSVYTSAMDVLINIKDPEACRLYYQEFDVKCDHGVMESYKPCGEVRFVEIEPGTRQVNLRSADRDDGTYEGTELESGAVYGIWAGGPADTCTPDNVEFFEWYDLSEDPVIYDVVDGELITEGAFWYAMTSGRNESDYISEKHLSGFFSIPWQADGDYSLFAERAQLASQDSVRAFFRKGQLGAYVAGQQTAGSAERTE